MKKQRQMVKKCKDCGYVLGSNPFKCSKCARYQLQKELKKEQE